MSFALFLLLYAAVAIALIVVAGFIVRDLRRKRLAKSQPPDAPAGRERRPASVKLPGRRKAPAGEPQPETPPPPRRRQLQTFADAEKAANADLADEDAADLRASAETDYAQAVLNRLEDAFERLQAGTITLDAYRAEVLAEQAVIERRIAVLGNDPEGADMAAALAARESARWCLDWADEQARPGEIGAGE